MGVGAYFEYANVPDGTIDVQGIFDHVDYESDTYGLGIALDTNLTGNEPMNLRLTLGYHRTRRDFDLGGGVNSNGVTATATIGYGFARSSDYRIWIAPQVRVSFDHFDYSEDDIEMIRWGVGPQIGLNWALGKLTISGSLGYQYMFADIVEAQSNCDADVCITTSGTLDGREHLIGLQLLMFISP